MLLAPIYLSGKNGGLKIKTSKKSEKEHLFHNHSANPRMMIKNHGI